MTKSIISYILNIVYIEHIYYLVSI